MNNFGSSTYNSRYYEKLRVVDDMKNSRSLDKGSRCSEQHGAVDDMNDSGS